MTSWEAKGQGQISRKGHFFRSNLKAIFVQSQDFSSSDHLFTKLGTWPNQSAVKYSAPKLVSQIGFTYTSQSSLFSLRLIALVMLSINQHTPPPCVHTLVKAALGERKGALVASNVGQHWLEEGSFGRGIRYLRFRAAKRLRSGVEAVEPILRLVSPSRGRRARP